MSIKKIIIIFTLFGLGFLTVFNVSAKAGNDKKIYLFYGTGCPHCGRVDEFFTSEDLYSRYPIERKEIYFDRENALLFNTLMESLDVPDNKRGVPAVVIGDKVLIGDTPIINGFIEFADEYLNDTENSDIPAEDVNNGKSSITFAAVIAGSLVDAINPCAFAVLIILMTTVLAIGDAKKGLYSGLAFSISIFISYFLMGLGLYKAISIGGVSGTLFKAVGWVAIILGLLNLKDFFGMGKAF